MGWGPRRVREPEANPISKCHFHKQPIITPHTHLKREVWVTLTLWMGKLRPIQLRQNSSPMILKGMLQGEKGTWATFKPDQTGAPSFVQS